MPRCCQKRSVRGLAARSAASRSAAVISASWAAVCWVISASGAAGFLLTGTTVLRLYGEHNPSGDQGVKPGHGAVDAGEDVRALVAAELALHRLVEVRQLGQLADQLAVPLGDQGGLDLAGGGLAALGG